MTLNFIDVEDFRESMENLAQCEEMVDLYLTGNPCTQWEDYKDYVYAKVPQLKRLDGTDIHKSWRIQALQRLEKLENDLEALAKDSLLKKSTEEKDENAYT